jgi:hypothetical protein
MLRLVEIMFQYNVKLSAYRLVDDLLIRSCTNLINTIRITHKYYGDSNTINAARGSKENPQLLIVFR